MFGRRPDGKKVKGLDGLTKMMPLFMKSREGSVNYLTISVPAAKFDEFIAAKRAEGVTYAYRDIAIAILVRAFKMFPKCNRFIIGGRIYQRNHIDVSMALQKNLRAGDDETIAKLRFSGNETITDVKKKNDEIILKTISETNKTDTISDGLGKLPLFVMKIAVGFLRLFDRLGMLTDKLLFNASPFHCSIFFSDLKSIRLDKIYHHLYNFGNCGFFAAMGREKWLPVADQITHEVKAEKIIEVGISTDERFTDGLYYSNFVRAINKIISDLSCLERPPLDDEIRHIKTVKQIKIEKKVKKKEIKAIKKELKKESRAKTKAA